MRLAKKSGSNDLALAPAELQFLFKLLLLSKTSHSPISLRRKET
jgi:hypothetical protein